MGGRVWEVLTSENGQTRLGAVKQPLVLAYEGWTVVLQTFRHLAKLLQDESLIGVVVELLTTGHLIADDDAADPKPVALGSSATETVAEMCAEVVEHLTALSKSFSRTAKDPTPGAEFAKSGHPEDPTKARAEEQKRTKDLRTEIDRLKKELVEARKVAKSPRTPGGPPGTPGGNKVSPSYAPCVPSSALAPTLTHPHTPLAFPDRLLPIPQGRQDAYAAPGRLPHGRQRPAVSRVVRPTPQGGSPVPAPVVPT